MKNLHKLIYITLGALSLSAMTQAKAQIITQWNFASYGNTTSTPTNNPAPSTGLGTAEALGMTNNYTYTSTSSKGKVTVVATGAVNSDDVLTTAGTANSGFSEDTWRIRGANPGNGWNLSAPQYSQGAEFDASTAGYSDINVSFDWYSTTQGIRDLQFQYNTNINNAAGWTNFGGTSPTGTYIATSNDFYGATPTGGVVPITLNLSSINGVNNDPNFGIRLVSAYDSTGTLGNEYASAASTPGNIVVYNNNSGNWRFDNVTIAGTVAAPEPSTYVLMLGGFVTLTAFLRNRKNRAQNS